MIAINVAGAKYFGEFEFWFACIKIMTVVGLIIFCLVIDLGGGPDKDRRGFRYWKQEPFNADYLGIQPPAKARCASWHVVAIDERLTDVFNLAVADSSVSGLS